MTHSTLFWGKHIRPTNILHYPSLDLIFVDACNLQYKFNAETEFSSQNLASKMKLRLV